jgi:cytochrome c biogenesis protein CcdA
VVIVIADAAGTVSAVSGCVAALAAVVAIYYAKQAAVAGRDSLRTADEMRVDADGLYPRAG